MEENIFASELEHADTRAGSHLLKTILFSGLTVGVLDGLAATISTVLKGGSAIRVFQYISSGLFGPSAFQGGLWMAGLGVFLHFVIAFGASVVFVAASRLFPQLTRLPFYLTGPLYGILVYFFMRDVVIPLSLVTRLNYTAGASATGLIIHMLFVGLPIAYIVQRFADERR